MRSDKSDASLRVAALATQLAHLRQPVPLLVLRIPDLERTAWRDGLRKARALERRAGCAFAAAARRVLRTDDLTAHDQGSDRFLAALTAPQRASEDASSIDARSALARIAAVVESAIHIEVTTGWTMFVPDDAGAIEAVVERALIRGSQERERYSFFSAIGHELRTPLSSIRGYLETLLDEAIDPATRRRFLGIAYAESLRLGRLVDGMFEISLLDLEATGLRPRSCDVSTAFAEACAAVSSKANARSVELPTGILAAMCKIDADALTLVFINLLENAIKHGKAGGTVTLEVSRPREGCLRFDMDDDGPGIPTAERERIFTLGERGTTTASGTGIGLAFVRLLVQRAGGVIVALKSPRGGARFRLELPEAD